MQLIQSARICLSLEATHVSLFICTRRAQQLPTPKLRPTCDCLRSIYSMISQKLLLGTASQALHSMELLR